MTVFVVMGACGEYSDTIEWCVCVYADRALADKHADEAMRHGRRCTSATDRDKFAQDNPWDTEFKTDYTGTDYYVIEADLRDALPIATK